jgi:hypothetical protein
MSPQREYESRSGLSYIVNFSFNYLVRTGHRCDPACTNPRSSQPGPPLLQNSICLTVVAQSPSTYIVFFKRSVSCPAARASSAAQLLGVTPFGNDLFRTRGKACLGLSLLRIE